MKVLFWLYKSRINKKGEVPVFVRVTIKGKREQFSTGLSIQANSWNSNKQRLKGRGELSQSVNQILDKIEADLFSIYHQLTDSYTEVTSRDVRMRYLGDSVSQVGLIELFSLHNERIKSLIGKDYSEETYQIYERTRRNLIGFLRTKWGHHDIRLDRLKRSFIEEYIFFLKSVKEYHPNTIFKDVQRVNRIMNYAIVNDYLDKNPFRGTKVKREKKEITFLSMEEIRVLQEKQFVIERLSIVRDLFIFQCFTGLAYRELRNLTYANIQKVEDGSTWIVAQRQKTKRVFKVPLLPQAIQVLDRYREHTLDMTRSLLPVPSNQKLNAYLKEIGELCGIRQPLTTHLARRTFACTVTLKNGVPLSTVSALLGHSNISITQEAYAKVVDEKLSDDMDDLRRKLGA